MATVVLIFLLLSAAAGLAVAAVFLLAGLPWAMLTGAASLIAFALVLRRGVPGNE